MKNISIVVIALIIGIAGTLLVTGKANYDDSPDKVSNDTIQMEKISIDNPQLSMPVINAYYDGKEIWFIHTEVSDADIAQRLSTMVASDNMMGSMEMMGSMDTLFVPRLAELPKETTAKLYVFTNGVSQEGAKPWGGGPFGFQIDIFDSIPGEKDYTPLRNIYLVTWNEDATSEILMSENEIVEALESGELTVVQSDVIVNAPVIQ